MTVSPDQVEQHELTILSRLVECQKIAARTMDRLLDAGMHREWNEYLTMYWMVIETRLRYEARLAKVIETIKEKEPGWDLTMYLQLDSAVSHP